MNNISSLIIYFNFYNCHRSRIVRPHSVFRQAEERCIACNGSP